MATQEEGINHAHLRIAQNKFAILYLHTKDSRSIEIVLPPRLVKVTKFLMERHESFHGRTEHDVDEYISSKDLASQIPLHITDIYDARSYIFRLRFLIRCAAEEAGFAAEDFQDFISSKRYFGYAIYPKVTVSIQDDSDTKRGL